MKANRLTCIVVALALAAGLASIAWRQANPTGSAPTRPPEKITLAVSGGYIGSGLVFIAKDKGYFEKEGLDVTLQRQSSGRDSLRATLEGRAHLGVVGDTPLMFAAMKREPVSIVATVFTAGQAHGIVARRDRGVATPADLAGKTIGATFGTDGHFVAGVMLAAHGKPLEAVRLENIAPPDLEGALASGRVDAVSAWEPWIGKARQSLGDNAVIFLTDKGFLFGFHLAGHRDWVGANEESVVRVLRALIRAYEFAESKPREARALVLEATGAESSAFEPGGAIYRFQMRLDQSLLIMLEDQGRWAIAHGLADRGSLPNMLDIVDLRPLAVVKPRAISIVR